MLDANLNGTFFTGLEKNSAWKGVGWVAGRLFKQFAKGMENLDLQRLNYKCRIIQI